VTAHSLPITKSHFLRKLHERQIQHLEWERELFQQQFEGLERRGKWRAGGQVVQAGWNNAGYGNLIVIDHQNGYKTYYAHLSDFAVQVGATVNQGSLIGKSKIENLKSLISNL